MSLMKAFVNREIFESVTRVLDSVASSGLIAERMNSRSID